MNWKYLYGAVVKILKQIFQVMPVADQPWYNRGGWQEGFWSKGLPYGISGWKC